MAFSEEAVRAIEAYFTGFVNALATFLRLYRGQLGPNWAGIDQHACGALIYLTEVGMVFKIVPNPAAAGIRIRTDVRIEEALCARWRRVSSGSGVTGHASAVLKHLAGDPNVTMAVNTRGLQVLPGRSGCSFMAIGPVFYQGLSGPESERMAAFHTDRERTAAGFPPPTPPWLVSVVALRTGTDVLEGLDPDPFIAAKGVADIIARSAGLLAEDPAARYARARSELLEAVRTVNAHNEAAIHQVLLRYPWILVDEVDYESVESERSFSVIERVLDKNGGLADRAYSVRPDFLFHKHDHRTLVVEIEAASKRLITTRSEAGYQLAAAQTVAAQFQISAYQQIMSGPLGAQVRGALSMPDSWGFDFLLIVGSAQQADFDARTWHALRDILQRQGVMLQLWDHYLDRLARLQNAATVARSPIPCEA